MSRHRTGWALAALLALLLPSFLAPLGGDRARAADGPSQPTVVYDPPRLTVEGRGLSVTRLLEELGAKIGFSVVNYGAPPDPRSISIRGATVTDALRQLLRGGNYTVLYAAGRSGEPDGAPPTMARQPPRRRT